MKKLYIVFVIVFVAVILALISSSSNSPKKIAVVTQQSYVALGDSVSAGVGLQNYSDSSACNRTNQSYPNLVSSKLNFKLSNLSCSGATLAAGILGKQDVNNLLLSSQLDQLFQQPKTTLISLTIGANDIGWTDIISKCYVSICGSDSDSAQVNNSITSMQTSLQTALSEIQNNYKSVVPDVVVTGYHQVFPVSTSTCSDLTGISAAELAWGRQQQKALNSAIENTVSKYQFAKFVSINFTGHELCSSDSWVQGLNESAPFHPNQAGQQEYANEVIKGYQSFK